MFQSAAPGFPVSSLSWHFFQELGRAQDSHYNCHGQEKTSGPGHGYYKLMSNNSGAGAGKAGAGDGEGEGKAGATAGSS